MGENGTFKTRTLVYFLQPNPLEKRRYRISELCKQLLTEKKILINLVVFKIPLISLCKVFCAYI